jgi:hypothetical protein
MVGQQTTIHQFQRALFLKVDNNINVNIQEPFLFASNIRSESFQFLEFVTNDPSFQNNQYEHLVKINVYLDKDVNPTPIPGLFGLISNLMNLSDVNSYVQKERIYKPFMNGFGKLNLSIDQLVDLLSGLSPIIPDTVGKLKRYELIIDQATVGETSNRAISEQVTTTATAPVANYGISSRKL